MGDRAGDGVDSQLCGLRVPDEFKGHSLLEASRQADPARVKKFLSGDSVNFKHPHTGDTPLVRDGGIGRGGAMGDEGPGHWLGRGMG